MVNINSDAPIRAQAEDRLGYVPFARALAQALTHRTGDGFVIGVQAAWGMGKSSAINLALEEVVRIEAGTDPAERTKVRHFNPWLFSGLETLARGYLSELGRVIDETVGRDTPQGTRKVVERLIKGGAEMVGGAAALGAVYLSGGAAIPIAASIKSGVTGALNLGAHVLDNRSLDSMISELRHHLSGIRTRLVVVLDDLDRLQPDELRQILTLVKTFGNLPNVTHLLVYDRSIVDVALGPPRFGQPTFREKIIQVELDLPPPDRVGLRAMTIDRLIAVFGPEPPMAQSDWLEVTRVAFSRYLLTPRDVARLTNALSVSWPGVAGEAYVPDFFAMELLRHFERATYDALRVERDFLTGRAAFLSRREGEARSTRIVDTAQEAGRDDVRRLLARMFPAVLRGMGATPFYDGGAPPSFSGRRVYDPRGFDAYFAFSASPAEITVAELRVISERLDDAEFLRTCILDAMERRRPDGNSLSGQLLQELMEMIEHRAEAPDALLQILLELGDKLVEQRDETREFITTFDNRWRLNALFEGLMLKIPGDRFSLLNTCVTAPDASPHTAALLAARLAQQHGLVWGPAGAGRSDPVMSREQAEVIGRSVADRIARLADDGLLSTRPMIAIVLRIWSTFGEAAQARDYVVARLGDKDALTDLAMDVMVEVTLSVEPYRRRELHELPDPAVYDVARMADAIEGILGIGAGEHDDDLRHFVREARRLLASEGSHDGDG